MKNSKRERDFFSNGERSLQLALQQLREAQAQTEYVVDQIAEIVAQLGNGTRAGSKDVNAKINALLNSQMRTKAYLRNLIAALNRYFNERRNRN